MKTVIELTKCGVNQGVFAPDASDIVTNNHTHSSAMLCTECANMIREEVQNW